jgi:light-regulated signal transduction histidine kinase (bacteriophytochrome)
LPIITADPNQLANLLQNLISNSLKYRGEADPQIHISARRCTVEVTNPSSQDERSHLTKPSEKWLFSLQDNGIGIEPQYTERIFGIFQRLHTSDEYSGTGLGLAICRKIIERHEGHIWVESQLGQGATFFFTIPLSLKTHDDNSRSIT